MRKIHAKIRARPGGGGIGAAAAARPGAGAGRKQQTSWPETAEGWPEAADGLAGNSRTKNKTKNAKIHAL